MKKTIFLFLLALTTGASSLAQLTGIKTVGTGMDYATVAAAISALNANGVGAGGVIFNITAGHTETFPSPVSGRITTQGGSEANPIVFQKSGEGENPSITAGAGTGFMDAIISITGGDYITLDGIKLAENGANSNETTRMEKGIAILKESVVNGSQHITIKNCIISLNALHISTKGIYANNHTATSESLLTVTAISGTNSSLKIYGNTLSDCYSCIYINGYNAPAPYTYYDQDNEIGVDGANNINSIGGDAFAAYGIYTRYQNDLKVANNIVICTTTGTRSVYGIYMTDSKNASFELFNNYVSIQYFTSDGYNTNLYGIYSDMGASGISNTANIYGNTVENCTHTDNISAEMYMIYLRNLGVTVNIYNNEVSGNVIGSLTALGGGPFRHIYIQITSTITGKIKVYGNTVSGNSRLRSAPGSGDTYMLAVLGSGTNLDCYDNIIDNNSINSFGSTQCMYITFNDEEYKNVYNNTISNISNANGSTRGIYIGNGTLALIHNNIIQNISSSSSGTSSFITGITHSNLCASAYYYNNMISNLDNSGSESIEGYDYMTLCGFNIESEFPGYVPILKGFYNNTVYLDSETDASSFGSAAFYTHTLYGVDLRNNIFVNTSESAGANGNTSAIRSRTPGFTGFTSNYNCLYAGTPGPANLIFKNPATAAQTLTDYKTLVTPQELQSVTEMPPFVNITTVPYDLHLLSNTATRCEAGAILVNSPVSVSSDIDNQMRYPNSSYPVNPSYPPNAPDIGADEIGGVPNDLMPPAIVYTPLGNTAIGSARTLVVKITDGKGVPQSGIGLPRLYWKRNSNPYTGVTASYLSGNNYSFTFGGGATTGDIIYYYIVAQDLVGTPNTGAYPWIGASGFTANPPACSVPPSSPSSYTIVAGIEGEFHVGAGKTYTTLTAAVNDLNLRGITGPVTFILDDNTYPGENYPIVFNPNSGSGPTKTVTIRPNTGAVPVFTGSVSGSGLIMFKGLDYATINGSNSGGTDISITFRNTSTSSGSYVLGITTNGGSDGSKNITVKNCIMKGSNEVLLSETFVIYFNQNGGLDGGNYDNCLFENNIITKAKNGIYVEATPDKRNSKISIINNIIGSMDPAEYLNRWGIAISQSDSTLISGNNIMGPADGTDLINQWGIYFFNYSTNTRVIGNIVHNWVSNGRFSVGIKCNIENSSFPSEISNNVIYNIGCYGLNAGVSQNNPYGIFVRAGGNVRIWNNSIYLDGPYLYGGDNYAPSSACIGLYIYATNQFDIRNNILRNSMTNSYEDPGPEVEGKAYGIMFAGDASMFTLLDNNDYFINGFNGQIAQHFSQETGYTNFPDLESWRTYTGKEANSISADPLYISPIVLDLQKESPAIGMATPIPQVTVDVDGIPRHPTYPTIGAYEYDPPLNLTWTGALSTNWGNSGNWTPAGVPKYFTEAIIPSVPAGGLVFPSVPAAGGPFSVGMLQVGTGASVTLQNGSTLKIDGN